MRLNLASGDLVGDSIGKNVDAAHGVWVSLADEGRKAKWGWGPSRSALMKIQRNTVSGSRFGSIGAFGWRSGLPLR
jgi:hypothetical protein